MGNSGLTPTGEVAIFDPASFIGDAEFGLNSAPWSVLNFVFLILMAVVRWKYRYGSFVSLIWFRLDFNPYSNESGFRPHQEHGHWIGEAFCQFSCAACVGHIAVEHMLLCGEWIHTSWEWSGLTVVNLLWVRVALSEANWSLYFNCGFQAFGVFILHIAFLGVAYRSCIWRLDSSGTFSWIHCWFLCSISWSVATSGGIWKTAPAIPTLSFAKPFSDIWRRVLHPCNSHGRSDSSKLSLVICLMVWFLPADFQSTMQAGNVQVFWK